MKPVKNTTHLVYITGDSWGGKKIIGLKLCEHVDLCQRDYINFDDCGGMRRMLETAGDNEGRGTCIWRRSQRGDQCYLISGEVK